MNMTCREGRVVPAERNTASLKARPSTCRNSSPWPSGLEWRVTAARY